MVSHAFLFDSDQSLDDSESSVILLTGCVGALGLSR